MRSATYMMNKRWQYTSQECMLTPLIQNLWTRCSVSFIWAHNFAWQMVPVEAHFCNICKCLWHQQKISFGCHFFTSWQKKFIYVWSFGEIQVHRLSLKCLIELVLKSHTLSHLLSMISWLQMVYLKRLWKLTQNWSTNDTVSKNQNYLLQISDHTLLQYAKGLTIGKLCSFLRFSHIGLTTLRNVGMQLLPSNSYQMGELCVLPGGLDIAMQ